MRGRGALAASRAFAAIVLLVAFIAAAVGLAGLSGCTAADSQQEGDTLRVGVRSDIVNFGYLNERTGKYYGLEIDIAEEMARRMGYADVEFVTVTPDTRKDMLMNGEVDCLAACYSISDTRLENFDFSPAYYTDDAVIMVENSSRITDIVELAECTFGAMSGFEHRAAAGAQANRPGLHLGHRRHHEPGRRQPVRHVQARADALVRGAFARA